MEFGLFGPLASLCTNKTETFTAAHSVALPETRLLSPHYDFFCCSALVLPKKMPCPLPEINSRIILILQEIREPFKIRNKAHPSVCVKLSLLKAQFV